MGGSLLPGAAMLRRTAAAPSARRGPDLHEDVAAEGTVAQLQAHEAAGGEVLGEAQDHVLRLDPLHSAGGGQGGHVVEAPGGRLSAVQAEVTVKLLQDLLQLLTELVQGVREAVRVREVRLEAPEPFVEVVLDRVGPLEAGGGGGARDRRLLREGGRRGGRGPWPQTLPRPRGSARAAANRWPVFGGPAAGPCQRSHALSRPEGRGEGGLAQGLGIRLFAFGSAYWPLATAHSHPLWAQTCCV